MKRTHESVDYIAHRDAKVLNTQQDTVLAAASLLAQASIDPRAAEQIKQVLVAPELLFAEESVFPSVVITSYIYARDPGLSTKYTAFALLVRWRQTSWTV